MSEKRITFFKTTLTSKGQITIPRQIRRLLGLEKTQPLFVHTDGSRIIVTVEDPETARPLSTGRPKHAELLKNSGVRSAIKHFKEQPL